MVLQHRAGVQQHAFVRAPLQVAEDARKFAAPGFSGAVVVRAGDGFLAQFAAPHPTQVGGPLFVHLQLDVAARLQQILVKKQHAEGGIDVVQIEPQIGVEAVAGVIGLDFPLALGGFHLVVGQLQIEGARILLRRLEQSRRLASL